MRNLSCATSTRTMSTYKLSWKPTGCILKSVIICLLLPACFPKFQYRRSEYIVYLLEEKGIWSELKHMCKSSGGYFATFTTVDELNAVADYVKMNYPDGLYEIGLSRQAGLDQNAEENWKWETGEEFSYSIPWGHAQPDLGNSNYSAVRIEMSTRKMFDIPATGINPNVKSSGYICEYGITMHCERFYGGCFDLCVAVPELSNNSVKCSCVCPMTSILFQDGRACNRSKVNPLILPSSTFGPQEENLTTHMKAGDINNVCSSSTSHMTIGMFCVGVVAGVLGVITAQQCYSRIQRKTQTDKRGTDKRKHDTDMDYTVCIEKKTYQDMQHREEETAYVNVKPGKI